MPNLKTKMRYDKLVEDYGNIPDKELMGKLNAIDAELLKRDTIRKKLEAERKLDFEKEIKEIFKNCEGKPLEDWWDNRSLGYNTFRNMIELGELYEGWEKDMQKAIYSTKANLKCYQHTHNEHIKRLEDFAAKLKGRDKNLK